MRRRLALGKSVILTIAALLGSATGRRVRGHTMYLYARFLVVAIIPICFVLLVRTACVFATFVGFSFVVFETGDSRIGRLLSVPAASRRMPDFKVSLRLRCHTVRVLSVSRRGGSDKVAAVLLFDGAGARTAIGAHDSYSWWE